MNQQFFKQLGWKLWIPATIMALGVLAAGASVIQGPLAEQVMEPASALAAQTQAAELPEVTVYKSPACGCCSGWAEHLRKAGFTVTEEDVADIMAVKHEHGIPRELGSCHTAVVGDYLVEGHVPAEDIVRLLNEKPEVAGLAVPGMPVGSPGMEMEGRKDPYASLTFDLDGNTAIWAYH